LYFYYILNQQKALKTKFLGLFVDPIFSKKPF
jgi:hypothetical protein